MVLPYRVRTRTRIDALARIMRCIRSAHARVDPLRIDSFWLFGSVTRGMPARVQTRHCRWLSELSTRLSGASTHTSTGNRPLAHGAFVQLTKFKLRKLIQAAENARKQMKRRMKSGRVCKRQHRLAATRIGGNTDRRRWTDDGGVASVGDERCVVVRCTKRSGGRDRGWAAVGGVPRRVVTIKPPSSHQRTVTGELASPAHQERTRGTRHAWK